MCQQSHFMDLSIARWIQSRHSGLDAADTSKTETNENEVESLLIRYSVRVGIESNRHYVYRRITKMTQVTPSIHS